MAEYADLTDTIGRMKRAAMDCWMADNGFYPNWGNDQIYAKWGWMLNFYNRPDEHGNGGGDGNGVNDSVEPQFADIRAAIDARVSKWLGLPDGSACETPISALGTTAALLGASGAGDSVQNSGEIAVSNGTIQETVINRITGSFTNPFLDKYYTQFSKVYHGLGVACVILQANYLGERVMWPAVRADVAMICHNAQQAWKQKAGGAAAANGTMVFTVIAAVSGAVISVLTAGTGAVAAVAVLGTIAAAATIAVEGISANAEISGNSYGEILDSLDEALGKLNEAVYDQERVLRSMMNEAIASMSGDLASYNLDSFSLGPYPTSHATMSMDDSSVGFVSTNMGRIESVLTQASSALGGAPASNPTPRDAGVGLGAAGTHASATELYDLTSRSLSLTAAEYGRGHRLFDATAQDFFDSDAAARATLITLLASEALTTEP